MYNRYHHIRFYNCFENIFIPYDIYLDSSVRSPDKFTQPLAMLTIYLDEGVKRTRILCLHI